MVSTPAVDVGDVGRYRDRLRPRVTSGTAAVEKSTHRNATDRKVAENVEDKRLRKVIAKPADRTQKRKVDDVKDLGGSKEAKRQKKVDTARPPTKRRERHVIAPSKNTSRVQSRLSRRHQAHPPSPVEEPATTGHDSLEGLSIASPRLLSYESQATQQRSVINDPSVQPIGLPNEPQLEPEFTVIFECPTAPLPNDTANLMVLAGAAENIIPVPETPGNNDISIEETPDRGQDIDEGVSGNQELAESLPDASDLDMHEIVPNLFLGSCSVFSPDRIDRFRSLGIQKIFTLRRRCEIIQDWDIAANQTIGNDRYFIRKWIEVEDNQWQDFLSLFPRLVKNIHKAIRKGEKVFVHCEKGRSRSVTVVLAYLMKYRRMDACGACKHVLQIRPDINPNAGFVRQLYVWNAIKFDFHNRRDTPEYKQWEMTRNAKIIAQNERAIGRAILIDRTPLSRTMKDFTERFPTPVDDPRKGMRRYPTLEKPRESYYRCCECEYPLAPANATLSFSVTHKLFSPLPGCTHIFLCNPLSWMQDQIDTDSPGGKLYCPNCGDGSYHVGEYCWFGVQCHNADCGEIMAPGLALVRRLDGGVQAGVEFRRVREPEEDGNEVLSSEHSSVVDEEGDVQDDVEEEQHVQVDIEEEQVDDNYIWGDHGMTDQSHQTTPPPLITPSNNSPPLREQRVSPLRNPHHLPAISSPLRRVWTPRSTQSTSSSSQSSESQLSSSGNFDPADPWLFDTTAMTEIPEEISIPNQQNDSQDSPTPRSYQEYLFDTLDEFETNSFLEDTF